MLIRTTIRIPEFLNEIIVREVVENSYEFFKGCWVVLLAKTFNFCVYLDHDTDPEILRISR